jgi:hypothetical protein
VRWTPGSRTSRVPTITCALLALLSARALALAGQAADRWSARQRIPGIQDDALTPYLAADRNRTVHAFHSQAAHVDPSQLAIVYSQWTLRNGWTLPTDIVLPPSRGQASILGAMLDDQGILHIVFFSGDDAVANLYYSRAWASEASKPRAWSAPELIGEAAITPRTATLASDEQGTLTVVYSGNLQGVGLYTTHSRDRGATWSEAVPLFFVQRDDLEPWANNDPRAWNPQVARDDAGRLHLTWVVVGKDGNGKAIYYARWEADGLHWTEPLLLAAVGPDVYEVDWPSIVAHHGDLFVIYDDHSPPERMMRISRDTGRSWSNPAAVLAPTVGEYGNAAFAVDGGNTLHVVFGDRARGLNLWHSVWDAGRWREPEPIASTMEAEAYRSGPEEFHPSQPRVVVSQGNVLLAVWQTDPGRTHNGTWFAYKLLDVPEVPIEPLPAPPSWVVSHRMPLGALLAALLVLILAALPYRHRHAARVAGGSE